MRKSYKTMKNKLLMLTVGVLLVTLVFAPPAQTQEQTVAAPAAASINPAVYRVYFASPKQLAYLTSAYDVLEARGRDARGDYLLVMGDDALAAEWKQQGYAIAVHEVLNKPDAARNFYGGYHSIAEHEAHMAGIAAARPDLAQVVVYGASWRKTQGMTNGFDLKAICLTRQQPGDCALNPNASKPRFFLMAAIHARELSTSELAWRWMDDLIANYNFDADVTALLNDNEIWIVPLVNPDGRDLVELGDAQSGFPWYQRKNAHATPGSPCAYPPNSNSQDGIDLNRNASFHWGGEGTSISPCSLLYRGASPGSEPEQAALEGFMGMLFKDQRGPLDGDAAPLTTTGAMVTLHSYSNLVLLPWGDSSPNAPNDAGLRSFAFRMSYFNRYQTGRPAEVLYAVSGSTDDWAYGVLGIPSFTFEVGPNTGSCGDFFPQYSCQDSLFWPRNREAFYYAAKNARQPYASAQGPNTLTPTLSLGRVGAGAVVTLSAIVDDSLYGNTLGSVGRPASQVISAAQAFVDAPPWAGGVAIPMMAQDGVFNTARETAVTALNTTGLSNGRHMLFVRAQDASGNWGAPTAQWLDIGWQVFLPFTQRAAGATW